MSKITIAQLSATVNEQNAAIAALTAQVEALTAKIEALTAKPTVAAAANKPKVERPAQKAKYETPKLTLVRFDIKASGDVFVAVGNGSLYKAHGINAETAEADIRANWAARLTADTKIVRV